MQQTAFALVATVVVAAGALLFGDLQPPTEQNSLSDSVAADFLEKESETLSHTCAPLKMHARA